MTELIKTELGALSAIGVGLQRAGQVGSHTGTITVVGAGSVSATVLIKGSNDGLTWTTVATITASGTGAGSSTGKWTDDYALWRKEVSALTGASVATQVVTDQSGGAAQPAGGVAATLRHVYVHQTLGRPSGLFPLSGRTGYCTGRAPGVVRKVQFEVSSGTNTATAFTGSFAVGAGYGDGANLKNAANANIALTPLTWGTTDPNDFGNPGGGANSANITGASGSDATYNTVEGRVFSDWMTVTPTQRIDFPGLGNPVTCRLYSVGQFPGSFGNDPPSGSGYGPNWNGAGEPEFGQGYFDGDQTTNANAVGAVNDPYGPTVRMRFLLDVPGQSHYSAGDSTVDGWSNGASIAAGATPGDIGGFVRKVRNWQIARGIPSSLCNGARAGRRSTLYLRMALREIMVNRFTHAWILPWSINETGAPTATPYNIQESLDVAVQILRACEIVGTKPILIEPVNSVGSGYQPAAVNAVLGPFLDNAEARGIAVVRTQRLLCDAAGNIRTGLFIDAAHPNEAGHEVLFRATVADALKYGLV